MTHIKLNVFITSLIIFFSDGCTSANAGIKIAILDFELNDLTSLPYTQAELTRTGSIKPLLEQAISQNTDYEIIHISQEGQKSANAGFGYLFRFHDEAARLGKQFGADWVIVGQHSKPSFLESSLIADVINVGIPSVAAELIVDLKGNHKKVTERAVMKLSEKIDRVILPRQK
jgi:hypothetical protein